MALFLILALLHIIALLLRDAIASVDVPVIEIHNQTYIAEKPFREKSVIAPVCIGQLTGFGTDGYPTGLSSISSPGKRGMKL